jgi:NadR type nicotinamide-nucleotide adenylyltransferase
LIKTIAVTGPESTGKSELSEQLAVHYNCLWVPEYARKYLNEINRPYEYNDVVNIAEEQQRMEKEYIKKSRNLLICDTELIVIKIWLEYKYRKCPEWISQSIQEHPHDLYLLMNTDLPWEFDPQREHPDLRSYFFNKFEKEMKTFKLNYRVVSGLGKERFLNAVKTINSYFKENNQ